MTHNKIPSTFRTEKEVPYCPGCGHNIITNNITKALEKIGLSPLDVIITSDIGCCGIIDPLFTCHTIHGLHGRSTALAMGVSLGLSSQYLSENESHSDKKVIAIQGDGGATIGLQHLLEAARQNVDMTLFVCNNMVYGMTGGQISGLSTSEFKSIKMPDESGVPPYNICELAHSAGASYSSRIIAKGDFSDQLVEAIETKGFSIVEIDGLCPAYGVKKINELYKTPFKEETLNNDREQHKIHIRKSHSLFDSITSVVPGLREGTGLPDISTGMQTRREIIIAGSAGEGVQSAADLLSFAGMACGFNTTKKGEYPITVGTGFSVAEVIISSDKIYYTGIEYPDVFIITSVEGLEKVKSRINKNSLIIADKSLDIPDGIEAITDDFRKMSGRKGAILTAIAFWLQYSKLFPVEALIDAAKTHKHADKLVSAIENINIHTSG
ncbi:MAG: thiamine pyrophosphate-dependent enzyme [Bacteroidota bacterium]